MAVAPGDHEQLLEDLSRTGCVPIRGEARGMTWEVCMVVALSAGDHLRCLTRDGFDAESVDSTVSWTLSLGCATSGYGEYSPRHAG